MIRVVLGVLLTTAVLGTALPAVDTARHDHSATLLSDRLDRFAYDLGRFDRMNDPGARWTRSLTIPSTTWGTAPASLRIHERAGRPRATWRIDGGPPTVVRLPSVVRVPSPIVTRGATLSLRATLEARPDGPVVVLRAFK